MKNKNYSKCRKPKVKIGRLIYINKSSRVIIKKNNGKKYQRKFQQLINAGFFENIKE